MCSHAALYSLRCTALKIVCLIPFFGFASVGWCWCMLYYAKCHWLRCRGLHHMHPQLNTQNHAAVNLLSNENVMSTHYHSLMRKPCAALNLHSFICCVCSLQGLHPHPQQMVSSRRFVLHHSLGRQLCALGGKLILICNCCLVLLEQQWGP